VGPCDHTIARFQVEDGGTVSNMCVAVYILNKQWRIAGKGWSFSFGVGRAVDKPLPQKIVVLRKVHNCFGRGLNMDGWRAFVNAVTGPKIP
jgi:hypothetical protein